MRAAVRAALAGSVPPPWVFLPLQTSLVAERANGCVGAAQLSLPTYTRASPAYVEQYDGLRTLVPSGAARMQGARYVRNYVAVTNFTSTWSKSGTLTLTTGVADPDGGTTAATLAAGAVDDVTYTSPALVSQNVRTRISIKRRTGTGTIRYIPPNNASYVDITSQITTSWKIFTVPVGAANGGTSAFIGLQIATSGDEVDVAFPQIEDVTGRANTAPSEFLHVGFAPYTSAPFFGAGVAALKYVQTLNGNTVASNVVTEATGAAIVAGATGVAATAPVDASGPNGCYSEGSRENLLIHSQDKATWNLFQLTSLTDASAIAPDGTTTMVKLLENATTNIHSFYNTSLTLSATTAYTWSLYVKGGLGRTWVGLDAFEAGASHVSYFDIGNVATGTNAAGNTSTITALPNGIYRLTITRTTTTGASSGLAASPATADNTNSYAGDITKGIYWWGAQLEAASFASSYIPTTTIAVTRAASVDQYVSAGNVPTNDFTPYGEIIWPSVPPTGNYYLWASYVDANNSTSVFWDGTNLVARRRIAGANNDATIAFTPTANTRAKWAATFSSTSGTQIYLNGTAGTADAVTTACQIGANFQVGADGNGANQSYASNSNARIWPVALPTGTLQSMTT